MDQGNLGRYSSGHRPFDRQTPELAFVEAADRLTALGRLKREVSNGLVDARMAQMQCIVRTHGQPIPGQVNELIRMDKSGGCHHHRCKETEVYRTGLTLTPEQQTIAQ